VTDGASGRGYGRLGRVGARAATWLAYSMCALSLALTAFSLVLLRSNLSHPGLPVYEFWVPNTLVALGFSPVGAFVASHLQPKNPMGWLLCTIGLFMGVAHLSAESAIHALLAAPHPSALGEAAAWMMSWFWVLPVGLSVFLFLLFPDGRLPGRRWRWFARISALLMLLGATYQAFSPGPVLGVEGIRNPLGVGGLPNAWEAIQAVLFALMFVAVASLFVRRLRARGVERQQLRWFTYAATLAICGIVLTYTVSEALGSALLGWVGGAIVVAGALGIPVAMGVAILRYRLYEIDIIVNRTLVYAAATLVLAGAFQAIDGALHYLLVTLAHEHSLAGSVVSALVVGALFHPVRHRIQRFVNGRLPSGEGEPGSSEEGLSPRERHAGHQ
jgi:hypothetical protein